MSCSDVSFDQDGASAAYPFYDLAEQAMLEAFGSAPHFDFCALPSPSHYTLSSTLLLKRSLWARVRSLTQLYNTLLSPVLVHLGAPVELDHPCFDR